MARKNQSRADRCDTAVATFRLAMEKAEEAISALESAKDDFKADLEGLEGGTGKLEGQHARKPSGQREVRHAGE